MILFINVYISNKTQGLRYLRGLKDETCDRLDVFKYSLASFAVIRWTEVIVYYELADDCSNRQDELESYILFLFHGAEIHRFQNQRQEQWQIAVNKLRDIPDNLVCFCCNDDHIFIDYDTQLLARLESVCNDAIQENPYISFVPTHWPEYLALQSIAYVDEEEYFIAKGQVTNSMQIVSKGLLDSWWFDHDYHGAWMPRTDSGTLINSKDLSPSNKRISVTPPAPYPVLVPYRELIRHFDGYSHVGMDINVCPPLFIPDGFFDHTIRVSYCVSQPKQGAVLVDPRKENYSVVDSHGADLKSVLQDLPLFWRHRICDIEIGEKVPTETLIEARNRAVAEAALWFHPLSVKKIRAALRFSSAQNEESAIAGIEDFIRQRTIDRHYKRSALNRTMKGVEYNQKWATEYRDKGNLGFYQSAYLNFDKPKTISSQSFSFIDNFKSGKLVAGNGHQAAIWTANIEGEECRAIFLHPPAKLEFHIMDCRPALLNFGVTIHPDVRAHLDQGNTIFKLYLDNHQILLIALDSNSLRSFPGWWNYSLFLPKVNRNEHVITFETDTIDGADHRWALWRDPVLIFQN